MSTDPRTWLKFSTKRQVELLLAANADLREQLAKALTQQVVREPETVPRVEEPATDRELREQELAALRAEVDVLRERRLPDDVKELQRQLRQARSRAGALDSRLADLQSANESLYRLR